MAQTWARDDGIAWVGFGFTGSKILSFALNHPEDWPQIIVVGTIGTFENYLAVKTEGGRIKN